MVDIRMAYTDEWGEQHSRRFVLTYNPKKVAFEQTARDDNYVWPGETWLSKARKRIGNWFGTY